MLGDPVWPDRCEQLAFNMLPAALDPAQHGTHYITSPNSVQLDNVPKTMGQFDDGFALQAYMPGVDQYRCCPQYEVAPGSTWNYGLVLDGSDPASAEVAFRAALVLLPF